MMIKGVVPQRDTKESIDKKEVETTGAGDVQQGQTIQQKSKKEADEIRGPRLQTGLAGTSWYPGEKMWRISVSGGQGKIERRDEKQFMGPKMKNQSWKAMGING